MIIIYEFIQLNVSVQVGDTAYFSNPEQNQGGKNHPTATTNTRPYVLGGITDVDHDTNKVTVNTTLNGGCHTCGYGGDPGPYEPTPVGNSYIFFQKDQKTNTSGVIGYFMEVEFRNYSHLPVEIFATAVDYAQSSK